MSIGGGGGGSTPNPPQFQPINAQQTEGLSLATDQLGYGLSDADLAARFPGLVAGRGEQISNAYNQLTGPLDPTVQNSFVTQGAEQAIGAFGAGNPFAGIGQGTAAGNTVATSLANNVQKKQDYDRAYFEGLMGANPQRQFGLTGGDIANIGVANTQGYNNYLQQLYGARVGNANAQGAANAQQEAAILAALAALGSAGIQQSDKRMKKDIASTGVKTGEGIPIKTFKFKGENKKRIGVIAQDVKKKRPDAVLSGRNGMMAVNYGKLLGDKV